MFFFQVMDATLVDACGGSSSFRSRARSASSFSLKLTGYGVGAAFNA
jgi:hypothetical protein